MNYDPYRPATSGYCAGNHTCGASPVICLHSSPVANDGLRVNKKQGTPKQRWALQQPHISNFRTWIMINVDHLHDLKKVGNRTCASSFTLTPLLTSGKWWPLGKTGTSNCKTVVDIAATAYLWILDMDYDQYRPATTGKNTRAHTCGACPVILAPFITSGKWWHVGQIGTSNSKTLVGIAVSTYLWIQDMDYDQHGPATL
jgi:hypothetical protein